MKYTEVKEQLEAIKLNLINKMDNPELTLEEKEELKKSIVNYEYIIELTDMNHYERGSIN
ncbi:DUF3896 family protein [Bacillus sp. B15-48]|uniref:DUF3896 family protein n=1 Tax=Bacillus sp. B15-48 TaxID=1548601 RepID=UPI0019401386|nr:DUF3896 family protein [Bacillus sp. B15-48]MBM4761801.1 DUF3896 domain-containing protein [Bacillus sp. B15-48]